MISNGCCQEMGSGASTSTLPWSHQSLLRASFVLVRQVYFMIYVAAATNIYSMPKPLIDVQVMIAVVV